MSNQGVSPVGISAVQQVMGPALGFMPVWLQHVITFQIYMFSSFTFLFKVLWYEIFPLARVPLWILIITYGSITGSWPGIVDHHKSNGENIYSKNYRVIYSFLIKFISSWSKFMFPRSLGALVFFTLCVCAQAARSPEIVVKNMLAMFSGSGKIFTGNPSEWASYFTVVCAIFNVHGFQRYFSGQALSPPATAAEKEVLYSFFTLTTKGDPRNIINTSSGGVTVRDGQAAAYELYRTYGTQSKHVIMNSILSFFKSSLSNNGDPGTAILSMENEFQTLNSNLVEENRLPKVFLVAAVYHMLSATGSYESVLATYATTDFQAIEFEQLKQAVIETYQHRRRSKLGGGSLDANVTALTSVRKDLAAIKQQVNSIQKGRKPIGAGRGNKKFNDNSQGKPKSKWLDPDEYKLQQRLVKDDPNGQCTLPLCVKKGFKHARIRCHHNPVVTNMAGKNQVKVIATPVAESKPGEEEDFGLDLD